MGWAIHKSYPLLKVCHNTTCNLFSFLNFFLIRKTKTFYLHNYNLEKYLSNPVLLYVGRAQQHSAAIIRACDWPKSVCRSCDWSKQKIFSNIVVSLLREESNAFMHSIFKTNTHLYLYLTFIYHGYLFIIICKQRSRDFFRGQ